MDLFVRSDSVISRVIAGETLIVPIRKGVGDLASIYSLNPVGSAIWEAVSIPRSKREIVDRVEQEFTGDPPRIELDVDSFLAELEHEGLVTSVGAPATL
jgi:coenzyme PQQ synthesis protein D (PqqD)